QSTACWQNSPIRSLKLFNAVICYLSGENARPSFHQAPSRRTKAYRELVSDALNADWRGAQCFVDGNADQLSDIAGNPWASSLLSNLAADRRGGLSSSLKKM